MIMMQVKLNHIAKIVNVPLKSPVRENCTQGSVGEAKGRSYLWLLPNHDIRWSLYELGRSSVFSKEYVGTSQNRRGLTNDAEEVGLTDSTQSIGKLCTRGSGQQWNVWLRTS